jgi:hypothetical protein
VRESAYVELLETFVERLRREGTPLILISVDGQLDRYPAIRASVDSLCARRTLTYLEVRDWLDGLANYHSPEGHLWGSPAHAAIGRGLAAYMRREILIADPDAPVAE